MLQVNYEEVDLRGQEVTFLIKKSLSGRIGWKGGNIVFEVSLYIYVFLYIYNICIDIERAKELYLMLNITLSVVLELYCILLSSSKFASAYHCI